MAFGLYTVTRWTIACNPLASSMKRSKPLRRTRINKVSAARRSRRFQRHYYSEAYVLAIKAMQCVVCLKRPCHAHHVKTKGAGGDYTNLVPLCPTHHREVHDSGVHTFRDRHPAADLTASAEDVYIRLSPLRAPPDS